MSSEEAGFSNVYSICGFAGALVFALSLVPQLWQTIRTRSTQDLSYLWQAAYLAGLFGLGVYCVAYRLWPLLIPGIVEFCEMLLLTFLKYYFERIHPKEKPMVVEIDVDGLEANKCEQSPSVGIEGDTTTSSAEECTASTAPLNPSKDVMDVALS